MFSLALQSNQTCLQKLINTHSYKKSSAGRKQSTGNPGKKSSQLTGSRSGEPALSKSSLQMMNVHGSIKPTGQVQGKSQKGATLAGKPLPMRLSNEDSFDETRISQWAAHIPTGVPKCDASGIQDPCGYEPIGFQAHYTNGLQAHNIANLTASYDSTVPCMAYNGGVSFSSAVATGTLPQGQDIVFHDGLPRDDFNTGLMVNTSCQAFSANIPSGSLDCSALDAPNSSLGLNYGDTTSSTWDTCGPSMYATSQALDWSPEVAFTPSSSLPSSHNFMACQPDTPVSMDALDGNFQAGSQSSVDGDLDVCSSFSLSEGIAMPPYLNNMDPERFVSCPVSMTSIDPVPSTIRPRQHAQRASIPAMGTWPGYGVQAQANGFPPNCSGFDTSRRSSEGETKNARDHPFYKAAPKEDGLYHCPYATSENCTHKAEKLKCNYE